MWLCRVVFRPGLWLALVVCAAGCDVGQVAGRLLDQVSGKSGRRTPSASIGLGERNPDEVRIASFNIQVLGTTKSNKQHVMEILADVVRNFDVVAVQEIRSKDDRIIPRFVELINAGGARYDYVIGPRLGRTSSKEQYAYLYNTDRIEVDRRRMYTIQDRRDLLHREPLVARFRVRGPPPEAAFTFTLVNIHTDPDETVTELNALDDVFVAVVNDGTREDDVILLGDLNVDENHLGELGRLPHIAWAISGLPTNTRKDKTYDNIVFSKRSTVEYTGQCGVFDLLKEYGLTEEEALEVSDHMPVWAIFSAYEGGRSSVASRPPASTIR